MTRQRFSVAAIALALGHAACGQDPTLVVLHLASDPSWQVDQYELKVGDHTATAAAQTDIELDLVDAVAAPLEIDVWGLAAGQQVAHGNGGVTPKLHQTVDVTIRLDSISCGTFCTEGAVECMGDGTSTCEIQDNGCLVWSAPTACPTGLPYCSHGACAATCTDDCAPGQTECDSAAGFRICGQYDSDSCLDWSPVMPCMEGQTCNGGMCSTQPVCAHDGDTCDDGNACTVSDSCSTGTCAGVPKCTQAPAHAMPTCGADGTCGFTCTSGFLASTTACVGTSGTPMPTAFDNLAAVTAPDNRVYVVGGRTAPEAEVTAFEVYTPSTDTWSSPSSLPAARASTGTVLVNNTIYVVGGTFQGLPQASVYAYNLTTNAWTTKTSLSTARNSVATVVGTDGKIYAIGGWAAISTMGTETAYGSIATVDAYTPSTNSWQSRTAMPGSRGNAAAALGPDGLIYVFGGLLYTGTNDTVLGTVLAYNPATDTWTTRAPMPTARENALAVLASDGLIYLIGGDDETTASTSVLAYSPAMNTWTTRASLPSTRSRGAAVADQGLIYVFGGTIDFTHGVANVDIYSPMINAW